MCKFRDSMVKGGVTETFEHFRLQGLPLERNLTGRKTGPSTRSMPGLRFKGRCRYQ
jgi:hypothetical protein